MRQVKLVNNKTRNIRCDIFKTRNTSNMNLFIFNHIKNDNNIITDGWPAYSFLDDEDVPYTHEIFIHGPNGQFGFGPHSTSHIEGVWSLLKRQIKKLYSNIPHNNFLLFLREAELLYIMSSLTNKEKEDKLIEIFQYLYNSCDFDLYELDELLDNNSYYY